MALKYPLVLNGTNIEELQASDFIDANAVTATVANTAITANTATYANNVAINNDTSSNSTHYVHFGDATTDYDGVKVSSTKLTFNPSSGLLTSTDYNSSSDKRLKKEIVKVNNALETIHQLRGVTFKWRETDNLSYGLIAQEVEKILPEIVNKDDSGYLGIKYNAIISLLLEAIKELSNEVNLLKKK